MFILNPDKDPNIISQFIKFGIEIEGVPQIKNQDIIHERCNFILQHCPSV